jgi:hypothetical protein
MTSGAASTTSGGSPTIWAAVLALMPVAWWLSDSAPIWAISEACCRGFFAVCPYVYILPDYCSRQVARHRWWYWFGTREALFIHRALASALFAMAGAALLAWWRIWRHWAVRAAIVVAGVFLPWTPLAADVSEIFAVDHGPFAVTGARVASVYAICVGTTLLAPGSTAFRRTLLLISAAYVALLFTWGNILTGVWWLGWRSGAPMASFLLLLCAGLGGPLSNAFAFGASADLPGASAPVSRAVPLAMRRSLAMLGIGELVFAAFTIAVVILCWPIDTERVLLPKYEAEFGFRGGRFVVPGAGSGRYYGLVSVDANGPLGRAGFHVGDVPMAPHGGGTNEFEWALRHARCGEAKELTVLRVPLGAAGHTQNHRLIVPPTGTARAEDCSDE